LRIVVAATPEVAIASLQALLDSSHNLVAVITQPDKPAGRGMELTESAVSTWAQSQSVPLYKPETDDEFLGLLSGVDILITIGYGKILSSTIINAPAFGSLNLHFSLLPRWRGAAPVQRAIEARDQVTGVTVFQLDEGMDTGPIFTVKRFALDSDITSDELFAELALLGPEAISETLHMIEKGTRPTPQKSDGATRALKLHREEGRIDWSQPADVISAHIRAFTSNPGAWTDFRGTKIRLEAPAISERKLLPGALEIFEKRLYVGSGTTALTFGFITSPGKTRMEASSWINGARIALGESFGETIG
jgi:methionyl-tRNA formyltransferase